MEGNSSELADDLLHGNIDLIIDMLPFKVENVESVPICEEEILLAVPDSVLEHAFPGRLKEIKKQLSEHTDLKLLANCPFLLINKGNRVRTIADEMFEDVSLHDPRGAYQSIFGLDVDEDFRHQGLAGRLMKALIEKAESEGRKGLILTCKEHLIGFYEQFGYCSMGVSKSVHGGAVWYDMILEFSR